PLPLRISKNRVLEAIDPWKDVDGMTAKNLKGLWIGDRNSLMPATTKGILALFDYYKIPVMGKKVVVVGRSLLVGKPVAMAFTNRHATVATVCHKRTKNLEEVTKKADILVVAVGKIKLITKKHVSAGQVIIDVGINMTSDKKLTGDVDFENVKKIVRAITPVPGGIGPMTVASLFENLLLAYESQNHKKIKRK
ncbi:MAG: bifunctional methylenetetrahydrofolate dehydrogenase/methenyltetrahydrofolate cyclohydrolase, partial [Patescibacteria group bacterium]